MDAINFLDAFAVVQAWEKHGVTFNTNGHGMRKPDCLLTEMSKLNDSTRQALIRAIEEHESLPDLVTIEGSILNTCYICGEEPDFETDGLIIRPKSPCQYPNGIPLTFELNIPSGIMIVANDLRPHFDYEGDYNVNTAMGCVETTKAMEEIGCAHAFVGNSCPSVFKTGENTFIISSGGYDEETGKDINPAGVRVAGIVTDLWWYSIVDSDEFERRGCEGHFDVDRVQVKPGVYRFTHYKHLKHVESDEPYTYTLIELVRPI